MLRRSGANRQRRLAMHARGSQAALAVAHSRSRQLESHGPVIPLTKAQVRD